MICTVCRILEPHEVIKERNSDNQRQNDAGTLPEDTPQRRTLIPRRRVVTAKCRLVGFVTMILKGHLLIPHVALPLMDRCGFVPTSLPVLK